MAEIYAPAGPGRWRKPPQEWPEQARDMRAWVERVGKAILFLTGRTQDLNKRLDALEAWQNEQERNKAEAREKMDGPVPYDTLNRRAYDDAKRHIDGKDGRLA